jgi:hypothetical protein
MDGALVEPSALEEVLDLVMDHLVTLDAQDPDLSATLANGEVEISIDVEVPDNVDPARTEAEATGNGVGTIRTAYHQAGVATPDWELHSRRTIVEPQLDDDPQGAALAAGV